MPRLAGVLAAAGLFLAGVLLGVLRAAGVLGVRGMPVLPVLVICVAWMG